MDLYSFQFKWKEILLHPIISTKFIVLSRKQKMSRKLQICKKNKVLLKFQHFLIVTFSLLHYGTLI